ncbi:MAG: MFS transporter, partial [Pseudomonadota bacterium]
PIFLLGLGTFLGFAALLPMTGFWPILIVGSLALWLFSTLIPLADVLAMRAQAAGQVDYGWLRAFGSAAFILATIVLGWAMELTGSQAILYGLLICSIALAASARLLPVEPRSGGRPPPIALADTARLAGRPAFLAFLLAVAALQASHGVYYAFGSIHWTRLGYSDVTIGFLWGVGVAAEVGFLAVSGWLSKRFSASLLLAAAGVAAIVRWTLTALDPPLWTLWILQSLHAFTFAATHIASVVFVVRAAPERLAGTAMTLTASAGFGAATGLAALAAGPLYATSGPGAYFAMAGLGVVGLLGALALMRIWDGGLVDQAPHLKDARSSP